MPTTEYKKYKCTQFSHYLLPEQNIIERISWFILNLSESHGLGIQILHLTRFNRFSRLWSKTLFNKKTLSKILLQNTSTKLNWCSVWKYTNDVIILEKLDYISTNLWRHCRNISLEILNYDYFSTTCTHFTAILSQHPWRSCWFIQQH